VDHQVSGSAEVPGAGGPAATGVLTVSRSGNRTDGHT